MNIGRLKQVLCNLKYNTIFSFEYNWASLTLEWNMGRNDGMENGMENGMEW